MNEPTRAVFLSYASQDAEAARRICEALRAAGLEVWFDQSELRGGDAWDASIRKQIRECALFVPLISANTDARSEGYFRLEWRLAVKRSHLMADDQAFLMPVLIDETPEKKARVPDRFRERQWLRLVDGETPPSVVERVTRLLSTATPADAHALAPTTNTTSSPQPRIHSRRRWWAMGAVAVLACIAAAWWSISLLKPSSGAANAPSPLSIAVLPFAAPGGNAAEQQLADSFSRELTSAFERMFRSARVISPGNAAAYKDKSIDARNVARELNVRYLAEGEIRRHGHQFVVEVKLVDAATAIQSWSERVQVSGQQLEQGGGTLVPQLAIRLRDALWAAAVRGARAPPASGASAMDLVLHGWAVWSGDENTLRGALEARKWFDRALRLEGDFVPALLGRARTLDYELDLDPHPKRDRLLAEMDELTFRAASIESASPSTWGWRAVALWRQWRWDAALEAIAKQEKLDPGNALNNRAGVMVLMGRPAEALALIDQQLASDPQGREVLGWAAFHQCRAYLALGRYDEAIAACQRQIALDSWYQPHIYLLAAYAQGAHASRAAAEKATLLKLRPGFSIADFKALGFSDSPAFLQQTETHLFAGLRKAGIAER